MSTEDATRTLYIRDVPEDVHATLRTRAAAEGMAVSAYVLRLLREEAETPTVAEVFARRREPVALTNAEILDAIREGRR
ncbi:MAG: FitA-like ribbon-helix-helix domain-containing protein [Streptosporangiaceae bacterium]